MTIRNAMNTKMSRLPAIIRYPPARAVVTMPNFRTSWADTTKTATMYSALNSAPSTLSSLSKRPWRYLRPASLTLRSLDVSRNSCTPSVASSVLSNLYLLYLSWNLFERITMVNDTGMGHSDAVPITGLNTRIITPSMAMQIIDPMSSGNQCDMDCSCIVQSPMILTVRSVGSFFPK